MDEKGTHNVKFLTKNYTKEILSRTRVWATAWKAPRLQPPARTAARYATHAQRSQQHANAEVICHLQLVFWLVKNALNAFCLVAFLKHNNALRLSLGGRISNFIVSLSTTAYMSGNAYLGFSAQRNKLLSIYIKIKSQYNFSKRRWQTRLGL